MKTLKDRFMAEVARRWRSAGSAARIGTAICAGAAIAAGLMLARTSVAQQAPGSSAPAAEKEVGAAIAASLALVLADPAHPLDPEGLQSAVRANFTALYPYLAERENLQDPAFAQAQADSYATVLHPETVEAALQKDPVAMRQRAEALSALNQGVAESTAEYFKALSAKLPTLEQARQADAQLWNNPEWRWQREAPVRALAPQPHTLDPSKP